MNTVISSVARNLKKDISFSFDMTYIISYTVSLKSGKTSKK